MINPFTFLRENKVVLMLRAKVLELFEERKAELKELAEGYINDKSGVAKELLISFLAAHVKLKFPYSLFKGIIRKHIEKNLDRLVEFIVEKIRGV